VYLLDWNSKEQTKSFFRLSTGNYKRDTHQSDFPCKGCGALFDNEEDLTEHHCIIDHTTVTCQKCSLVFPNFCILNIHYDKVCSPFAKLMSNEMYSKVSSKPALPPASNETNVVGGGSATCFEEANRQFTIQNGIIICKICKRDFKSRNGVLGHIRAEHVRELHQCSICPATFKYLSSLRKHNIVKHLKEKRYECEDCGKSYFDSWILKEHRMKKHEKIAAPFLCDLCGKNFYKFFSLRAHIKRHFPGEAVKTWHCPCGISFSNEVELDLHLARIHKPDGPTLFNSGEEIKNHSCTQKMTGQCDLCPRKYKSIRRLQIHRAVKHHKTLGYKCSYCDRLFSLKRLLQNHEMFHTGTRPYKCLLCHLSFVSNHDLKQHLLVHTGEKPHKCDVCGVGFARKHQVLNHMRTHTGEKPYVCICGKAFAQVGDRNKHKKLGRCHKGEKSQLTSNERSTKLKDMQLTCRNFDEPAGQKVIVLKRSKSKTP